MRPFITKKLKNSQAEFPGKRRVRCVGVWLECVGLDVLGFAPALVLSWRWVRPAGNLAGALTPWRGAEKGRVV